MAIRFLIGQGRGKNYHLAEGMQKPHPPNSGCGRKILASLGDQAGSGLAVRASLRLSSRVGWGKMVSLA